MEDQMCPEDINCAKCKLGREITAACRKKLSKEEA
jgi:hypothetical protein